MKAYNQMKTSEIVEKMSTQDALAKIVRVRIESMSDNDEDNESIHENKKSLLKKNK